MLSVSRLITFVGLCQLACGGFVGKCPTYKWKTFISTFTREEKKDEEKNQSHHVCDKNIYATSKDTSTNKPNFSSHVQKSYTENVYKSLTDGREQHRTFSSETSGPAYFIYTLMQLLEPFMFSFFFTILKWKHIEIYRISFLKKCWKYTFFLILIRHQNDTSTPSDWQLDIKLYVTSNS